jgi:hypothetical protein
MKASKLFTVVLVTALIFANTACACASIAQGNDSAGHQHMMMQNASEHVPCHHQECEGCDERLDGCATPDYGVVSNDRDSRLIGANPSNLDDPELELAFVDKGQPRASPANHVLNAPYIRPLFRQVDTPIQRKDQLTE